MRVSSESFAGTVPARGSAYETRALVPMSEPLNLASFGHSVATV
jgi:hypothetical protein